MSGCFAWIFLLAGGVFVIASLLRWFEQTADAMDQGQWNKLAVLVVCPFACWFYPSRISAGRPTAVPHHEPVRGFGMGSSTQTEMPMPSDQPPPGTPKEFLGMPKIAEKKPKAPVDPEKLAKLKQKMREQGMLDE
jgi:hypothetical protein